MAANDKRLTTVTQLTTSTSDLQFLDVNNKVIETVNISSSWMRYDVMGFLTIGDDFRDGYIQFGELDAAAMGYGNLAALEVAVKDEIVGSGGGGGTDPQTAINTANIASNSADLITLESDKLDVSEVIDEDNMVSDSATKVPSQQSVKAYVDNTVAGLTALEAEDIDTLAEINAIIGDATLIRVEDTDTTSFQFVVDEDDMLSDDATKVPTQQSVKAYVDNAVPPLDDATTASDDATGSGGTATTAARSDHKHAAQGVSADTDNLIAVGTDGLHQLEADAELISVDSDNMLIKGTDGKLTASLDAATIGVPLTGDYVLGWTNGTLTIFPK